MSPSEKGNAKLRYAILAMLFAYWKSEPRQRLGLDLIVEISGFKLSLGGGLAYLAALGTQPGNIKEESLSLGISYTFSR